MWLNQLQAFSSTTTGVAYSTASSTPSIAEEIRERNSSSSNEYRSGKTTSVQWDLIKGLKICDGMYIIYQDENKRSSSRRADSIDVIIYAERIGRYIEGEYTRRLGRMTVGI